MKYININFPFKNSKKGFFLDLTENDDTAIKSDLIHILLTRKGQRLYLPDFGTDLLRFIFEPEDELTFNFIKDDIKNTVKKYLPNLTINDVIVTESLDNAYMAEIFIDYTVTDGVFQTNDSLKVKV